MPSSSRQNPQPKIKNNVVSILTHLSPEQRHTFALRANAAAKRKRENNEQTKPKPTSNAEQSQQQQQGVGFFFTRIKVFIDKLMMRNTEHHSNKKGA
ncbi:hypothetical protein [Thalassotalea sp. PLHSN55]|uniref:hypothetical protein n=1 Tax=Thalassotalea sp. PLHSN55 TaxID=3435888 RepID=UPI003F8349CF